MQEEINKQNEYINKVRELNKGEKKTYHIVTMGCQLNENDSQKLAGMLIDMGYSQVQDENVADVIIFNTCAVRENAEKKLFGKLGEIKQLRKDKEDLIVGIAGCMMQQEHIIEKLKKSFGWVDVVFGTHTLYKLPELIYKSYIDKLKIIDVENVDGKIYEDISIKRDDSVRATVTIMEGCNNFCSYCIVPYVRGRERSRQPEKILEDIRKLKKDGYKEVTLLGQNVNSYGKDIGLDFADLLEKILEESGDMRIRFVSAHPKDFSDKLINLISKDNSICEAIHLPLQSGSTEVLRQMNRKYTKQQYLELAKKIKEAIPNATFSTDIIVGFPGETEEDFEDTLDVVRQVGYTMIYMFIYSPRVGTPAAIMGNQVPEDVKVERLMRLKKLWMDMLDVSNQELIGKQVEILVEGKSKTNDKVFTGRTRGGQVVNVEATDDVIGEFINVKIVSQHLWYLKGEIIG